MVFNNLVRSSPSEGGLGGETLQFTSEALAAEK
jgi:hypothetical protein